MKILKNILAILAGIIIGSIVNSGLLELGNHLIATPEGFDNSTTEKLVETFHLLKPANFLTVFLAHGLGTLVGAFIAAKIAVTKKRLFSLVIGVLFLIAGITMVFIVPSPMWFNAVDLILAYIPMAWLGWKLVGSK